MEAALAKALKVIVRNASIDMGIKSTMGMGKKDLQRRTKNGYEGGKVVTWDASAIYVKSEIQRFKGQLHFRHAFLDNGTRVKIQREGTMGRS
jgi:hypothetical protein